MSDIAQLYLEKLEDKTLILSPDSESRCKLNAAIREELQLSFTKAHDPGCKRVMRVPSDWKVSAQFGGPGDCYRYKLKQVWGDGPLVAWFLMNCSGAGIMITDATVAKCARIAKRLGFGGQMIGNACAYRATDRMRLLEVADPVGPENRKALLEMAAEAAMIIVAHGQLPGKLQVHADAMTSLLRNAGYQLHVLKIQNGVPIHPLARGKCHVQEDIQPVLYA